MLRTRHWERLLLQACIDGRQLFVVDNTNAANASRRRIMEPARAAGFGLIGWEEDSDGNWRGGMTYEDIVGFHGHACPGLAIGYRMTCAAMEALKAVRSGDEEIVAIVENDACGVDALQYISGCTFGKGNLIFRDYGKQVYTLFSRNSGKGVRVVYHGEAIPADVAGDRAARAAYILQAPSEQILTVREVTMNEPERARSRPSVVCSRCGEEVMETRLREVNGESVCIPCAELTAAQ